MYRTLTLLLLLLPLITFAQGYHIKGHIPASQNGTYIYLYGIDYSNLNPKIVDSSLITDGRFDFHGQLQTPGLLASIYLKDIRTFFAQLLVENRDITATAILRDSSHPIPRIQTINNPLTKQYDAWKAATATPVYRMYRQLDSMENAGAPPAVMDSLKKTLAIEKTVLKEKKIRFIRERPNDYISLFWLRYDLSSSLSPSLLDSLFKGLSISLRRLPEGKGLQEIIAAIHQREPGRQLPSFEFPDSSGRIVKLTDFRGQYVLIDFWASWCQPCVAAIPEMKEIYNTWHTRGLSVVSISLDDKADHWKNALDKYQMPWPQVSDLKGWKSKAAKQYNITAIPTTILVDKTGKVVAVDPDLSQLLPALLK